MRRLLLYPDALILWCGFDSTGLPVGVQVVARHWDDHIVLAVMGALEEHFRRTPDYPDPADLVV